MALLLKQVTILDPTSPHHNQIKDIFIKNGKIASISNTIREQAETFHIEGTLVSPGWFDVGAFVGDPGLEHIETLDSLLNASARGGFTSVAVFPNTLPAVQSKSEVEYLKTKATNHLTSVYPLGALTKDCAGKQLAEIVDMHSAGAVAFTDGLKSIQNPGVLLRALEYIKVIDGLVMNHPHTHGVGPEGQIHEGHVSVSLGLAGIPGLSEEMMVKRDLDLLRYSGSRLHIHNISSKESIQLIQQAKLEGLRVTCSVPAMNLKDTVEKTKDFDVNYKVQPPLREETDRKALIEGLMNGTIDFVCSNHRPVEIEKKKLEFTYADFGASGLETAFSTAVSAKTGKKWLELIVKNWAVDSRQIFGLPVPSVQKNNLAELTLFHPKKRWTADFDRLESKSTNNPYSGQSLKGSVLGVINGKKHRIFEADEIG